MGFITQPDTGGFEDFLDRRRKRKFVSGGTGAGVEEDTAVLGTILDSEAERQKRLAEISANREMAENQLAQQQSQFNQSQSFQKRQTEKARRSEFIGGITGAALQGLSTVGGFAILKKFKIL